MVSKYDKIIYDLIIIGGGCSGLSALLYSARFKLNCIMLTKDIGGSLNWAKNVDNYLGIENVSGVDLIEKFKNHAMKFYNENSIKYENVLDLEKKNEIFEITTNKTKYFSKTIILATGSKTRKLNINGEKKFFKKGVYYSTMSNFNSYKDKTVCVVGGSDSACKDALILAKNSNKVYLIYRKDKLRWEPIIYDEILKNNKIEIIYNTNINEIKGDKYVNSIILDNNLDELNVDLVVIAIGNTPMSLISKKLGVNVNEKNEIIIDTMSSTNIFGVYAAGDVTNNPFKQVITGVSEGALASYSAHLYLKQKK
ncbi:MAG: NAD(P)/FAD-dependent oxidoreductase [Nanoarchaeota archaeon]